MVRRATKAKMLLALALLRELFNKVRYYRSVVEKNIDRYQQYIERVSRIAPERIHAIQRELNSLEVFKLQLSRIEVFLESVMLRIETLVAAGNIAVAVKTLQTVVSELKKTISYSVPFIGVVIDQLDAVAKEVASEIRSTGTSFSGVAVTSEAKKIVDEAKSIAGLR